jgi:hypothetical protein
MMEGEGTEERVREGCDVSRGLLASSYGPIAKLFEPIGDLGL